MRLAQTRKHTGSNADLFKNVYSAVHFTGGDCKPCADKNGNQSGAANYGWQKDDGGYYRIGVVTMEGKGGFEGMVQMVHELGHAYDYANGNISDKGSMPDNVYTRDSLRPNGYWYNGVFTADDTVLLYQMHPNYMSNGSSRGEVFADIFVAWTLDAWNEDPANSQAVADAQAWMPHNP